MYKVLTRIIVMITITACLAMSFTISFASGTAHASAAHPLVCRTGSATANWSGKLYQVNTKNTDCQRFTEFAWDDVANCTGGYFNAQTDVWITQQPYPGGSRSGETGRSNWVTYPNNCTYYYVHTSDVWPGLSDPSYGCGWIQYGNGEAHDYMCDLVPGT